MEYTSGWALWRWQCQFHVVCLLFPRVGYRRQTLFSGGIWALFFIILKTKPHLDQLSGHAPVEVDPVYGGHDTVPNQAAVDEEAAVEPGLGDVVRRGLHQQHREEQQTDNDEVHVPPDLT